MSLDFNSELVEWSKSLILKSRKLQSIAKATQKLTADPFAARKQISKLNGTLEDLGFTELAPPSEVTDEIEANCLTQEAEFWGRLKEACHSEGWELIGSTNRRLLHRGIFVEQEGYQVRVEGVSNVCTPHVPTLIETLRPEVNGLLPSEGKEFRKLMQALTAAYEIAGGRGEVSIEKVYRLTVLQVQKPTFWSGMHPKSLQRFTRPMFRALISKLLSESVLLEPHSSLRLGTTIDPKDAWEVFSPGEGRVVQVGRLSIA